MDYLPRRRNGSGRGPRPARRAPLRWAARSQRPAAWLWVSLHLHLTAQRLQDKPQPCTRHPRKPLSSGQPGSQPCPLPEPLSSQTPGPPGPAQSQSMDTICAPAPPPPAPAPAPTRVGAMEALPFCSSRPRPSGGQKMQAPPLTSQPTESQTQPGSRKPGTTE